MSSIKNLGNRVLLVVMDGYGINPDSPKNAIIDAKTPTIDELFANYPYTTIEGGGLAVGLPEGVAGNSEVGHMNLGAGRPIRQDLVRINDAVQSGVLKDLPMMRELINHASTHSKKIHLMGLLSDGGVHSDISHIKEIINLLNNENKNFKIYFHALMDGRDTPRDSGVKYVQELQTVPNFTFASMQGRSIGMDRDKRYEKTEVAYRMLTGQGTILNVDPISYIQSEYQKEIYDEFITPVLFDDNCKIGSDDTVFFCNFRPDRAIQITQSFTKKNFDEFDTSIQPSYYLCMTPYITDEIILPILFDKEPLSNGLSEFLSNMGIEQLKIAETEKYAHVTYFFNGGKKDPYPGEQRILVPSPQDVKTYDEKPQMSAFEVCDKLLDKLDDEAIKFYLVNFANADMVGHTGNYEAAVKAVESVEACIKMLVKKCDQLGVPVVITADHGNSDQMIHGDGGPHTSHTDSPVPICIYHKTLKNSEVKMNTSATAWALKDIAPTVLYIMGIESPENFEGKNIFI